MVFGAGSLSPAPNAAGMPTCLPPEKRNWRLMSEMFGTVAPRYDFITRAFSYGMDRRWKRSAVELAALPPNPLVLDLASGTGDFSRIACAQVPPARSIAVDLTEGMLRIARRNGVERAVCADAGRLPFADGSFDCVFVGYGLRNFPDLACALREVERVTKPGGLLVTLDFFLPARPLIRGLYLAYLYAQGAFWGTVLHGKPRVYTYIPDSLRSFVSMEGFSDSLEEAGYSVVRSRGFIFGGIGLHWAAKIGRPAAGRSAAAARIG